MTRLHKIVLWTVAVCVFGYVAANILIVQAPGPVQGQTPPRNPGLVIESDETDNAPLGGRLTVPASALDRTDRGLVAECIGDRGELLDDVMVDIFRQTGGAAPGTPPRVESFGRTKTTGGGRLAISLPLILGYTGKSEAAAMYLLYFTAPGRQIKSMIVDNGTNLPRRIVVPTRSSEVVYVPRSHLVVATSTGVAIGRIGGAEGFVDQRNHDQGTSVSTSSSGVFPPLQAAPEWIRAARQRLTDARTDQEKDVARAQLRQVLVEIFAQDMQLREKQATEIESRLAKLRQQYQARQKVKDEIIDLQLKVIEQDTAGLGFPGVSSTTKTLPPQVNEPLRSSTRKLDDFKRNYAHAITELKNRGHFIESPDGKLYAHAHVWANNHSIIQVIDSLTGTRLGTAWVNSIVGPLQFTDQGVASREPDGSLQLRIPLIRRDGPDGVVFEVPSTAASSPLEAASATTDSESSQAETTPDSASTAADLLRERVRLLFEALAAGNSSLESVLAACNDLATAEGPGKRAEHIARLEQLVQMGEELLKAGQATTPELLAVKAAYESARSQPATSDTSSSDATSRVREPHAVFSVEYNAIRDQYRKAKAALGAAESRFNTIVADAQKHRPETTVEEVKQQHPSAWRAVENARPEFEIAQRLLDTKLELLDLDRKVATLARDTAMKRFDQLSDLAKQGAVATSRLDELKSAIDAAELNIERATTLINLFKSIRSEPVPPPTGPASTQSSDPSASDDPVTVSDVTRREAIAMLQGTWNCVAASNQDEQLAKEQLTALALQFSIKDDEVTISYYGDDLQQHQTAGKLLIDPSTSAPRFHIDINVLGIQAQSRLTGFARIDRGRLRMHRPGDTFLIHRKFEFEPVVFEFRKASDSVRPEDDETRSDAHGNPGTRVPTLPSGAGVSVRDMLVFRPEVAGIDYDQPTEKEIDACRVVLEAGEAWTLLDRNLVLLRRFVDKNRDGNVDLWAYYKAGKEVYREVDSDYDGKIDHREGADDGRDDRGPKTAELPSSEADRSAAGR